MPEPLRDDLIQTTTGGFWEFGLGPHTSMIRTLSRKPSPQSLSGFQVVIYTCVVTDCVL